MGANNPGIDYSGPCSTVNRNTATGIRYGVISQHSISEALNFTDIDYGTPCCPECGNDAVEYSEEKHGDYEAYSRHASADYACEHCEHYLDSEHVYADEAQGWSYTGDGYILQDCLDSDCMIIESPYFTRAQFCSPCVPGACSIESPRDDGPRAYCLGHDWFEDSKAPYPVYSVATGELVLPDSAPSAAEQSSVQSC